MTTYIDLQSLGPTEETARLRRQLLGLEGTEVWNDDDRTSVLANLSPGDVLLCRPGSLPFWRGAPYGSIIQVIEEPSYEDPIRYRYGDWLVWALVQAGVSVSGARWLARNPPKTNKHQYFAHFRRATDTAALMETRHEKRSAQPDNPERDIERNEPFSWRLASNEDAPLLIDLWLKPAVERSEVIGVDVECDIAGEEPNEMKDTLVGLSVVIGDDAVYFKREQAGLTWPVLAGARLVGANLKYDLCVMTRAAKDDGYELHFKPENVAGDSMVAAYLLCLPTGSLKKLVKLEYNVDMITYADVTEGKTKKISEVDPNLTAHYCCADSYWAKRLECDLSKRLGDYTSKIYREDDLPLITTLVNMELRGIGLDRDTAVQELADVEAELASLDFKINNLVEDSGFKLSPIRKVCKGCRNGKNKRLTCEECRGDGVFFFPVSLNPGSPAQVSKWLFDHLKLPIKKISSKTRQPSTDSLSLLRLKDAHKAVPLLLKHKHLSKYHGFLVSWLKESERDGRIHTIFRNATVVSGRLSSSEPNLQQIKEDWRKLFVSKDNEKLIVAADESQFEVRIAAFQSRDPKLMAIVNSEPGTPEGDLHAQTMYYVFGIPFSKQKEYGHIRIAAKTYNFAGLFYGASAPSLVEQIEMRALEVPELNIQIPTVREAAKNLAGVRELYRHYSYEYVPATIERARDRGNTFYTAFGRPRVIPDLSSGYKEAREAAEREGVNHTIQGTAADLMRKAMNIAEKLEHGMLLAQNHDELIFEVDRQWLSWYTTNVVRIMELGQPLEGVPLVVDIRWGPSWKK